VGAEQQVAGAADRLAQGLGEALRVLEGLQGQLPGVEGGVGPDRIELDRGEALGDAVRGLLRGRVRVGVDAGVVGALRLEVGVGA
jgi:hypothetical protein